MEKEYISYMNRLNEYQKAAVFDEHRACLVNANVGSGKTTVLIAKVMYLHLKKQVPYDRMVVLTFTNKAAGEIRERMMRLEPQLTENDLPWFGTFHSVAMKLLQEKLPVLTFGYSKDFQVIDSDGEMELCEQIIHENDLKIKYKNRLKKKLEKFRNSPASPKKTDDDFLSLVTLLREKEREQDKMTFHDLIRYTNQSLPEIPAFADYVIVDEVQDCDSSQLAMIHSLMEQKRAFGETFLFAVGDPNQVIYSWRGSVCNVFFRLKETYQAAEYTLPVNYRSSGMILEAAECFKQQGERLLGTGQSGTLLNIKKQYDAFEDALFIAGEIKEIIGTTEMHYKDIALFYRLQSQSEVYGNVFKRENIPFRVFRKHSLRDVSVLYFVYKILAFSLHLDDVAAAESVLRDKVYGPGLSKAKAEKSVREVLKTLEQTGSVDAFLLKDGKHKKNTVPEILLLMAGFQKHFFEKNEDSVTPSVIYDYFKLGECLHPNGASFEEDYELVMKMLEFLLKNEGAGSFFDRLSDGLNALILQGVSALEDREEETDAVSLMTLHAAKGLEFSHVYIVGMNQGLFPMKRSGSFEDQEEERRLFYVGITRAKKSLTFTYYINPDHYGALPEASKFLSMLPEELLEDDGKLHPKVSLRELKEMVIKEKENAKENEPAKEEKAEDKKIFHHDHYGDGTVIFEDDMMITADFPGYGEKTFVKAFL